jgi:hypothetical protein
MAQVYEKGNKDIDHWCKCTKKEYVYTKDDSLKMLKNGV